MKIHTVFKVLPKVIEKKLKRLRDKIFFTSRRVKDIENTVYELKDLLLFQTNNQRKIESTNPLNRYGQKAFSQSDEDGITLEIIKRLKIKKGTFAEFGVGDGLENNTIILAALGWKGFWVSGQTLSINTTNHDNFAFYQSWITLDNISDCLEKGLTDLQIKSLDVISLDLDGNDIYFVETLLENNVHPKLFIVEYNAQFPPPAKFQIEYDPNHTWLGDNYFGAALQNYFDLFARFEFTLICCNSSTGANAFFIKNDYLHLFEDAPKDISRIYSPPNYYLYKNYGHRQSAKVVEQILNGEEIR